MTTFLKVTAAAQLIAQGHHHLMDRTELGQQLLPLDLIGRGLQLPANLSELQTQGITAGQPVVSAAQVLSRLWMAPRSDIAPF